MRLSFAARCTCAAVALLWARAAAAADGAIRLQFDSDACQTAMTLGESRDLHVYVVLDGATRDGFTGVEYSMKIGADNDADPGWTFLERFAPGTTVSLGTGSFVPPDHNRLPIDSNGNLMRQYRGRGVNVAFSECQTGHHGMVLIETVRITAAGGSTLRIQAVDHDTPGNSFFRCPLATLCDAPVYTKVCLGDNVVPCINPPAPAGPPALCSTSGTAVINPAPGVSAPCVPTAVQASTWSSVKGLYR